LFEIGTDSTGEISAWDIIFGITVGQPGKMIATNFRSLTGTGQDSGDNLGGQGINNDSPGTWVETVNLSAVPEPSTFALLGTGILGVAGVARRRFSFRAPGE
jgi:hypothetical protein